MPALPKNSRRRATVNDPEAPQEDRTRVSTPWDVGGGIVRPGAAGQQHSAAAGGTTVDRRRGTKWWGLPRRNARDPLTITVKLRGGPENWVEVHARGRVGRYPGYVRLDQVVFDVNSQR